MKTSVWLATATAAALAAQITLLYLPDPTGASSPHPQSQTPSGVGGDGIGGIGGAGSYGPSRVAANSGAEFDGTVESDSEIAPLVENVKHLARQIINKAPRNFDKVVHASIFGAATATAVASLPDRWWWSAPLAQGLHALGGEHLQKHIPGRGYDRADIYANLVGVGAGTLAGLGVRQLGRPRRLP